MTKASYRRRLTLVDRKFQLGMSLKIVLCLACYLVLFSLMAVFSPFLVLLVGGGSEDALTAASEEVSFFAQQLFLPTVLTFTCLALHCILISHRIAGPVYRIRKTFESMAGGDLSRDIRLRDGDYLCPLADAVNDLSGVIRADILELRSGLDELIATGRQGEIGEMESTPALSRIVAIGERLNELLAEYRLGVEAAPTTATTDAGEAATDDVVKIAVEADGEPSRI